MSLGLLLLGGALGQLAAIAASRRTPRLWLAFTIAGATATMLGAGAILGGSIPEWDWRGGRVAGEAVHLHVDAISALFLALLATIGACGALYAHGYWRPSNHPRTAPAGRTWWSLLQLCIGAVFVCANGLHFLIAWELFAVTAYFLVALDRGRREVRAAGWLYLAASHAGTLCLFAFFTALAARTGSWDLGPMRDRTEFAPLFWLALVGFGLKAGLFPLHIWLPSAHANAPSHVSAVMSGLSIKVGIYGLVRFSGWLPVPISAAWTIATVGVASAVLGVAFALGQHDLKRLLAYHSVENIGIILIGVGFSLVATAHGAATWGLLLLTGGLLHVWNHGLFKALLFLGAGSVLHATGLREMSRLGGLWRAMPWTAALFALGAVAISGLPPLNGFVSEWLVYLGLFDAAVSHGPSVWAVIPAAILLAATGALALACFAKVCGVVFLGAPRSRAAAHAHESGLVMRAPMVVLAVCCTAIGLAPIAFWPAIARAAVAWQPAWREVAAPPSLAILGWAQTGLALAATVAAAALWRRARTRAKQAPTWDCGYEFPTARIQYTAGSFAATITDWFAWILRPQRQANLPTATLPEGASYNEHTPETVLEHIVEPVAGFFLGTAMTARKLQHGRLQAYVLYLLLGLGALGCLVMLGGPQ